MFKGVPTINSGLEEAVMDSWKVVIMTKPRFVATECGQKVLWTVLVTFKAMWRHGLVFSFVILVSKSGEMPLLSSLSDTLQTKIAMKFVADVRQSMRNSARRFSTNHRPRKSMTGKAKWRERQVPRFDSVKTGQITQRNAMFEGKILVLQNHQHLIMLLSGFCKYLRHVSVQFRRLIDGDTQSVSSSSKE